jgi:hypothetical protein
MDAIRRHPSKTNAEIAKSLYKIKSVEVKAVRDGSEIPAHVDQTGPSGFSLRGARVLSRRPFESAAKFIKRLPNGRGFDVPSLSKEWGMGEETIRKHARDMGCLKYVEISEDEWMPLVMNPETAKQYPV